VADLVSLIVMSYNKRAYTEACLRSMARSTYRPLEIVVVEQGSTDGSVELLQELAGLLERAGIAVRVLWNESNVGAPGGRNQGMRETRGAYVGWVDNDIVVKHEDWLERLTGVLAADASIGIVSPKLLFPPPDERIEFAGGGVTRKGRVVYLGRGRARDDAAFAEARDVQCLISACVLLPRAAIDKAGPMDEAYSPVQYEDIDYCYRLKSLGYRCRLEPSVEMYHYEHVTTDGSTEFKFLDVTTRNGFFFRKRWREAFEQEDGPDDGEWRWENLARVRLEEELE
jgi:O-antigen biosynthesis protein